MGLHWNIPSEEIFHFFLYIGGFSNLCCDHLASGYVKIKRESLCTEFLINVGYGYFTDEKDKIILCLDVVKLYYVYSWVVLAWNIIDIPDHFQLIGTIWPKHILIIKTY